MVAVTVSDAIPVSVSVPSVTVTVVVGVSFLSQPHRQ